MISFSHMGLPQPLLTSLERMGFSQPTSVQEQAIPFALQGKDVLASSQTGSGKTAAFGIPVVAHLMAQEDTSALILTPTRELATQVHKTLLQLLGPKKTLRSALLIGGESYAPQLSQLRSKPRLIVGTPGRINDHLLRGTLTLKNANFLVLDEFDRMLDLGFGIQLEEIAKYLPELRQTLMFSATIPNNMEKLTKKYLTDPVRVTIGNPSSPVSHIQQELVQTIEKDKYNQLIQQIEKREGSIIVFVKTKRGADILSDKLNQADHKADAIHGDLRQNKRERVINAFRKQKYRIMVATDVAARGLDIPHIAHVINYDLPQCPEDYIHRIGRTARAGAEGAAVCLITPSDRSKWRAIHALMNPGEKSTLEFKQSDGFSGNGRRGDRNTDRRHGKKPGSSSPRFGERRSYAKRDENASDYSQDRPQKQRSFQKPTEHMERKHKTDQPERKSLKKSFTAGAFSARKKEAFDDERPRSQKPFGKKPLTENGEKKASYQSKQTNGQPAHKSGFKAGFKAGPKPAGKGFKKSDKPFSFKEKSAHRKDTRKFS